MLFDVSANIAINTQLVCVCMYWEGVCMYWEGVCVLGGCVYVLGGCVCVLGGCVCVGRVCVVKYQHHEECTTKLNKNNDNYKVSK